MSARSWQEILTLLFRRYEVAARTQFTPLSDAVGKDMAARTLNLCAHAIVHINELSEDKANRWLGFVQGVLCAAGIVDVDEERDYTRPLFHELKGVSPSHAVSSALPEA